MSFSEDILEVKKILKKQAILKPATKKLFKPASTANLARREELKPKPIFDDPKMQSIYDMMLEEGDSPEQAKAYTELVIHYSFPDFIMQQQFLDGLKDGKSIKKAHQDVTAAHRDYYGEAADFYGVGESVTEAGKLFKAAGKAEIQARPKPPKVIHYHVYDFDDMNNSTDQWTTDFDLAVRMAKKLVRDGWTRVRIGETEDSENDDSLEEEQSIWFGGDSEYGDDLDYTSEQARKDVEAGIDEALKEANKPFFKKAGEAEIDLRMAQSKTQNAADLRKTILGLIDEAGKEQQRVLDKCLRRLWLSSKDNAREDMIDLCVMLAREAENIYLASDYSDSSWKTEIWTIKEMCDFSPEEEANFMDQCDALGI